MGLVAQQCYQGNDTSGDNKRSENAQQTHYPDESNPQRWILDPMPGRDRQMDDE
jgi:hypothetical protein